MPTGQRRYAAEFAPFHAAQRPAPSQRRNARFSWPGVCLMTVVMTQRRAACRNLAVLDRLTSSRRPEARPRPRCRRRRCRRRHHRPDRRRICCCRRQSVIVLERGRCASIDTGHTTAHLTMVTDAQLAELVNQFGRDARASGVGCGTRRDRSDRHAGPRAGDRLRVRMGRWLPACAAGRRPVWELDDLAEGGRAGRSSASTRGSLTARAVCRRPGIRFTIKRDSTRDDIWRGLARAIAARGGAISRTQRGRGVLAISR